MPEVVPLRCAIFGGSFDPIHEGHREVARRCQDAFRLDRILWIPAAQPPHKLDQRLAPPHMRLALCMIATAHEPSWEVLPIELAREGPSYTYDTLLEVPDHVQRWLLPSKDGGLAERRRDLELYMIVGSDNLPGLPGWKNAEDVLAIARPIVVWRGGEDDGPSVEPDRGAEQLLVSLEGRLSDSAIARLRDGFIRLPPLPHSSTAIRRALASGLVPEGALDDEVLEFIREKGLYGWPVDSPVDSAGASDATHEVGDAVSRNLDSDVDPLGGDPAAWVHPGRRSRTAGPVARPLAGPAGTASSAGGSQDRHHLPGMNHGVDPGVEGP